MEIRHQRIESERRRSDKLWEGYRNLKDSPYLQPEASDVSLLSRATTHIKRLSDLNFRTVVMMNIN